MPEAAAPGRYAAWPRGAARALLAGLLVLLVAAALVPIRAGEGDAVPPSLTSAGPARERDADLLLYDHVIARLRHGEGYYAVVAQEHRRHHYPLRPGFAVRLPTLAKAEALLPPGALIPLSVLLLGAVLLAWWRRLATEPEALPLRTLALAALFFGASIGTIRYFFVLHELWAGQLLALSFALHRPGQRRGEPGRWLGAWCAAAAALAIREHALPFVLLMGAYAAWHRRWREAAAWALLAALFCAALAWHLHTVAALLRPDDPASASWITVRGLTGWLSMIILSGNLRWLPHELAGPLVVLALFGWSAWRSAAGVFGSLLLAGYAVLFMIAGRGDNFYWGMMVGAVLPMGLAFVPQGLAGLWRAAGGTKTIVSGDVAVQ
ncbi:hypothetical protein ACFOON_09170 [Novosphingobium piscinae]|uniref:Glycosyltransferase RgtA/B/C/D-like domain-containing protein n=1 Tax=Novosphingobium piscinae TaxID=1507448 RepID=A0A7X1KPV5_9SPHN|nr:hypothetical protein [Novosphingobium piscinae]MBC2669131.1 hypothetical protein [Novosphingobium piscinae]